MGGAHSDCKTQMAEARAHAQMAMMHFFIKIGLDINLVLQMTEEFSPRYRYKDNTVCSMEGVDFQWYIHDMAMYIDDHPVVRCWFNEKIDWDQIVTWLGYEGVGEDTMQQIVDARRLGKLTNTVLMCGRKDKRLEARSLVEVQHAAVNTYMQRITIPPSTSPGRLSHEGASSVKFVGNDTSPKGPSTTSYVMTGNVIFLGVLMLVGFLSFVLRLRKASRQRQPGAGNAKNCRHPGGILHGLSEGAISGSAAQCETLSTGLKPELVYGEDLEKACGSD